MTERTGSLKRRPDSQGSVNEYNAQQLVPSTRKYRLQSIRASREHWRNLPDVKPKTQMQGAQMARCEEKKLLFI